MTVPTGDHGVPTSPTSVHEVINWIVDKLHYLLDKAEADVDKFSGKHSADADTVAPTPVEVTPPSTSTVTPDTNSSTVTPSVP